MLNKNSIQLSDLQKLGLSQAENYGWHLMNGDMPTPNKDYIIVVNNESCVGVLKADGTIDVCNEALPINPFDEDYYALH